MNKLTLALAVLALTSSVAFVGCSGSTEAPDTSQAKESTSAENTGSVSEEASAEEKAISEAAEAYEAAAAVLEEKNTGLNEAIAKAEELLNGDIKPYDETVTQPLADAVKAARAALVSPVSTPSTLEGILDETDKVNAVDYSTVMSALENAEPAYINSVQQMTNVTNPPADFVISRLSRIDDISASEAVTEENDPNGMLNKAGGYTATVYFRSPLVDEADLYADPEYTEIVGYGTDGGGAVEVYANAEDANKRNDYLAELDGGILSSGSHSVVGTVLVRTSNYLTASQQKDLEAKVTEALLALE